MESSSVTMMILLLLVAAGASGHPSRRLASSSRRDSSSSSNCMKKVVMTEETVVARQQRCVHTVAESCFLTYSTAFRPRQVEECSESYRKHCVIEHRAVAVAGEVEVCSQGMVRRCDDGDEGDIKGRKEDKAKKRGRGRQPRRRRRRKRKTTGGGGRRGGRPRGEICTTESQTEKITFADVDSSTYVYAVFSFFPVAFGGALIGLIYGLLSSLACKYTSPDNKILEPTLILLSAYLSFLNAQLFHWSGIMALIACGLTQKRYGFQNLFEKSKVTVEIGVSILATIAETIIFLVLGFRVLDMEGVKWNYKLITLTIASCIVYRFIITYSIGYAINCYRLHKLSFNHMFMMSYGGLRGAVAFAMAASLRREKVKGIFTGVVLATVLFTVFVQGSTIKCLVNLMHFREQDHTDNFTSVTIKRMNYHLLAGMETILGGGGGSLMNVWMKIEKLDRKYMQPLMCREEKEQKKKFEMLKKQGKDHGRNNVLWGAQDYSKKLVARVKKDSSLRGYLQKVRGPPHSNQEKKQQVNKFKKAIAVSGQEQMRDSILMSDDHVNLACKRKVDMIRAMGHASSSSGEERPKLSKLETPSGEPPNSVKSGGQRGGLDKAEELPALRKRSGDTDKDTAKVASTTYSLTLWEPTTPGASKDVDVESGRLGKEKRQSPSTAGKKHQPASSQDSESAPKDKRSSSESSEEDRHLHQELRRKKRRKMILGSSSSVLLTKWSHR